MPRDEYWNVAWQMRIYEARNVGDDEWGWTSQALFRGRMDGAAPAALIEAVYFDAASGKVGEEFVISIYVIIEAVDEDQFCFGGSSGL
jgi:hypothetical protein